MISLYILLAFILGAAAALLGAHYGRRWFRPRITIGMPGVSLSMPVPILNQLQYGLDSERLPIIAGKPRKIRPAVPRGQKKHKPMTEEMADRQYLEAEMAGRGKRPRGDSGWTDPDEEGI